MKIDIIIPTFGQEDYTVDCLKSIREYTAKNLYRIIWVDNGSTAESRNKVLEELKNHNYLTVWIGYRAGFVVAVNEGIKASNAEFIVIQNNDTTVTPQWCEKLMYPLEKRKKIMISSPNTTEGTSQQSWDILKEKDEQWKDMPDLKGLNDEDTVRALHKVYKNKYVERPMAAFFSVMIKSKLFDEIGLLDEDYKEGYSDDVDFSYRTLQKGYKIVYVPAAFIRHHNRTTFLSIYSQEEISKKLHQNRALFKQKHNVARSKDGKNGNYYKSIQ